MKFSFKGKYRFLCKKCGSCCYQYSYSLTENEMLFIKDKLKSEQYKIRENTGRIKNILPYEVVFKSDYCPFLENNSCTIYEDRFIVCRLFPFDISYLRNDELLIDLTHCNGVSLDEGIIIDDKYMSLLMNELRAYNSAFYDSFIKFRRLEEYEQVYGFTRYDIVNPETKIYMRNYFIKLFNNSVLRDIPIELKQIAILDIYYKEFILILEEYLEKIGFKYYNFNNPILLLFFDVKQILTKYENVFEKEILKYVKYSRESKHYLLNEANTKEKVEINYDRKIVERSIEDEIEIVFRNGNKKNIKLKYMTLDKKFSKNAILETNKYFMELMRRYSKAGFSITITLQTMLESLSQLSWFLYNQSKACSLHKKIVNKKDVIEAISYLDRKAIINDLIRKIFEEYDN